METVAIIDLEPIGVSDDDARALTQRLTSQMIQIGKYTIVERSEMKRLLDEQKFQYSGCVDVACAVEIGKMLGAKTMVVGSVSKVGTVYSVDARMIDVKSAENYISADYTTTEDIGDLLIEGMKSIAYQLCEKKYTKSKIKQTNQNSNISNIPQKSHIVFKGRPKENLITVYINDDTAPKKLENIFKDNFSKIDSYNSKLQYNKWKGSYRVIGYDGTSKTFKSEDQARNYYNTINNVIGKGFEVSSGVHTIKIDAIGYKALIDTVLVDIGAGENYVYQYDLLPLNE